MQKHPMMQIIYENNVAVGPGISINHSHSTTEESFPLTKQRDDVPTPMSSFLLSLFLYFAFFVVLG
jgi:hypothetical protein